MGLVCDERERRGDIREGSNLVCWLYENVAPVHIALIHVSPVHIISVHVSPVQDSYYGIGMSCIDSLIKLYWPVTNGRGRVCGLALSG